MQQKFFCIINFHTCGAHTHLHNSSEQKKKLLETIKLGLSEKWLYVWWRSTNYILSLKAEIAAMEAKQSKCVIAVHALKAEDEIYSVDIERNNIMSHRSFRTITLWRARLHLAHFHLTFHPQFQYSLYNIEKSLNLTPKEL